MGIRRHSVLRISVFLLILIAATFAFAGDKVGKASGGGLSIEWQLTGSSEGTVLTVIAPDGQDYRLTFGAGKNPSFSVKDLADVEDGEYNYELRANQKISSKVKADLEKARKSGDEAAARKIMKAAGITDVVQSGAFRIYNGSIVAPGSEEGQEAKRVTNVTTNAAIPSGENVPARQRPDFGVVVNDQVIPDDLIVQGSACVGLDCVNNENFGFDTIRLKENNLRIHFDDTSSTAGFPANDWRLIANDSASGGQSQFSIEDSTGVRVPFLVEAGATTNSIYIDSTGRIGFRTSTPVLDIHINTSNTPAIRLEQNNSGGFTAQTWDIGANEANFFVRDVTGGSLLPFRIRPGAPTSSLDVSSDGDIGMGTASPEVALHVFGASNADTFAGFGADPDGSTGTESSFNIGYAGSSVGRGAGFFNVRPDSNATAPNPSLRFFIANTQAIIVDNERFIGIGSTTNPDAPIHYTNGATQARLTTAGVWQDSSSRAAKENILELDANAAFKALDELNPVTYNYKVLPDDPKVGFIAEDVPGIVATPEREGLSALDIVAVVTKVVKEQQKTIEQLNERIAELEKSQKNN